jgi:hypothetical protein
MTAACLASAARMRQALAARLSRADSYDVADLLRVGLQTVMRKMRRGASSRVQPKGSHLFRTEMQLTIQHVYMREAGARLRLQ